MTCRYRSGWPSTPPPPQWPCRSSPSPPSGRNHVSNALPVRRCVGLTQVGRRPPVRWLLKAIGLTALALLLAAAWFGSDSPALNPAPTWLYVWIWVGIIPLSLLFGPVWRLANPLRTLAGSGAAWVVSHPARRASPTGRRSRDSSDSSGSNSPTPTARIHSSSRASSRSTPIVNVAAGIIYGPRWFAIGDSFEVYAEVLAKLSPLGRDDQQRHLVLRNPLAGLATIPQERGMVALLCLLLGSTAFDGISRWSAWTTLTGELGPHQRISSFTPSGCWWQSRRSSPFFSGGPGDGSARIRPGALGNAGPAWRVRALAGTDRDRVRRRALLLVRDVPGPGRVAAGNRSVRPRLGPARGGGDRGSTTRSLGTGLIAGVQIGAIVLGHVLGVVSAHDRATQLFRRRQLRRAQYPMLAAMVAFTAGGIALVTAS